MTELIHSDTPATPPAVPGLDSFFQHVLYSNPFGVNRITLSSPLGEDASNVHHKQFSRLVELASEAHRSQLGIGAMIWGEAGVGKSHLLGRLGRWAGADQQQALFIPLSNLQAQPERLPRSLLNSVVSILTRGRTSTFSGTPLFLLIYAALGLPHEKWTGG